MNSPKHVLEDTTEEVRSLEYCIAAMMPEGILTDENGEEDPFVLAIVFEPVLAWRIMGHNFFGLNEYEKNKGLAQMPSSWYIKHGLTYSVPWTTNTLWSPCPFHKGRRVCETHFLDLAEVRKWKGTIPSPESAFELKWILHLKKAPMSKKEVEMFVLPPGYDFQRVNEDNSVAYIIIRKPEREEY